MSDIFAIFHVLMSSTTLWPDAVTGTCSSSTGISFLFTVATLVRISRAWTVFPFTRSHLTDSGTNLDYTKEYHVSEIHHQGVAKIFQSHDVIHTKSNNMVREVLGVLPFHQCGLGCIPWRAVICGLNLLVLCSAQRDFSSYQKPNFDLTCCDSARVIVSISKEICSAKSIETEIKWLLLFFDVEEFAKTRPDLGQLCHADEASQGKTKQLSSVAWHCSGDLVVYISRQVL